MIKKITRIFIGADYIRKALVTARFDFAYGSVQRESLPIPLSYLRQKVIIEEGVGVVIWSPVPVRAGK